MTLKRLWLPLPSRERAGERGLAASHAAQTLLASPPSPHPSPVKGEGAKTQRSKFTEGALAKRHAPDGVIKVTRNHGSFPRYSAVDKPPKQRNHQSLPINLPAIPHPHHQNTQGAIFDAGDNAAVANAVFPAGVGRNSKAYCAAWRTNGTPHAAGYAALTRPTISRKQACHTRHVTQSISKAAHRQLLSRGRGD